MYGSTEVLSTRASDARHAAEVLRVRARGLLADAGSMGWDSPAGELMRARLEETAATLGAQATALEDVAAALDVHVRSVEQVRAAIAEAERLVTGIWNTAANVAWNTVEVVRDVAEGAVTHAMRMIGPVLATPGVVSVAVYELGGAEFTQDEVSRARSLVGAIPALPQPGSRDWLDLRATVTAHGWG
ncbi:hypothetical protein [Agromyces cerinus]|uniref:Uncharacterized protein n=1 Tax=Agromyces cerinus subsp. cerinus TaxID=232089 RepID=A0A1N6H942_9MICO|nr:hypothetical protein [Agromyces cerinus]SIO16187.1 hypothetical protein SAMN05443544_2987 [Agromyces cerinus subsp. cerinus]